MSDVGTMYRSILVVNAAGQAISPATAGYTRR